MNDVILIGDDIGTVERNADGLLNAFKDICLTVKIDENKYLEVGYHRGMTANEHMALGSNFYEKVKILKYLMRNGSNMIMEIVKW